MLGYFVVDEVLYMLLDIGFVWSIFLDAGMTLLPHPVATAELEIDELSKTAIKADIDLLLGDNASAEKLSRINPSPVSCLITDVSIFIEGERRRLVLAGEEGNVAIETSLSTAEIRVYGC
jgi:hypothetical protein